MRDLKEMLQSIEKVIKTVEDLVGECKEYVQNIDNSLEDRWDLFIKVGQYIPIESYYFLPDGLENYSLYDDFYKDKFQVYNMEQLLETIEEGSLDVNIEIFKESCLSSFIYSCVNNW